MKKLTALLLAAIFTAAAQEPPSANPVGKRCLKLTTPNALAMGELPDDGIRTFTFTIANILDKPVRLRAARSGCPCISILTSPVGVTLQPNAETTISAQLDLSRLPAGHFRKPVFVETQEHATFPAFVTGTITRMFEVKPARAIQLGTFRGDTLWSRELTIISAFPDEAVAITAPPQSKHFTFAVKRNGPREFLLSFSPKLPVAPGKIEETIAIPVTGAEGYASFDITILGEATGMQLDLSQTRFDFQKKHMKSGQECEVIIKVGPRRRSARPRLHKAKSREPKFGTVTNGVAWMPAAIDEERERPLNDYNTWKDVADNLETHFPPQAKVDRVINVTGVTIVATFPDGFFNDKRTQVNGMILYRGISLGKVVITCR